MKGGDGGWIIFCLHNVMLQKYLLVGVGIPISERSGSLALQGEMGASRNLWIVCVAPLWLGGLRGK
jgi:hypothetical protein